MTTGRLVRTPAPPADATPVGRLAELLAGREHINVTIPRTKVTGDMRLLSRAERAQVHAEARTFLLTAMHTTDPNALLTPSAIADWNAEVAIRTLAIAVRAPENHNEALDSTEAWRTVIDDDQVGTLYQTYKDLADRLDPLGDDTAGLTEQEVAQLDAALKKKDAALLMSFGSRRLASFMLTSAEPPAS